nr:hypothetical protein [Fodinicola feengrottensis]
MDVRAVTDRFSLVSKDNHAPRNPLPPDDSVEPAVPPVGDHVPYDVKGRSKVVVKYVV